METLTIAYKILKGLEKRKGRPTSEAISPAAVNADPEKWLEVMESLIDEGYIKGVEIKKNVLGETDVDMDSAKITFSGAQYLSENSMMKKIASAVGDVIPVVGAILPK